MKIARQNQRMLTHISNKPREPTKFTEVRNLEEI